MARGIDIRTCTLVINLFAPRKSRKREALIDGPTYMHRVARTGRFEDKGIALSILRDID